MTDAAAGAEPAGGQEPYFAGTGGGAHAAPQTAVKPPETIEQRYLRETRNAAVFIAVVVGIVAMLSLIAVIVVGVQLGKVDKQLTNLNGSATSNCMSQGGTDPTC
jgi:hypothetical protein